LTEYPRIPAIRHAEEIKHHSDEPWVDKFLRELDQWIRNYSFRHSSKDFRFIPDNQLFVIFGEDCDEVLLCHKITYLEMLLFHPHVGQLLSKYLDDACRGVAKILMSQYSEMAAISSDGLMGLAALRENFYSSEVLKHLDAKGFKRPLPLGISGSVVIDGDSGSELVALRRNSLVAVNPKVWSVPIDGGVVDLAEPSGWLEALMDEARDELPLAASEIDRLSWDPLPFFSGSISGIDHEDDRIRSSGSNLVYSVRYDTKGRSSSQEILNVIGRNLRDPRYYETNSAALICLNSAQAIIKDIRRLGQPISGVLLHSIIETVAPAVAEDFLADLPDLRLSESAKISLYTRSQGRASVSQSNLEDVTLEGRFASNTLRRYPELGKACESAPKGLDEQGSVDEGPLVDWLVFILHRYHQAQNDVSPHEIGLIDPSRLFEAIVYQVVSYGFKNQPERIKTVVSVLKAEEDQNEGFFASLVKSSLESLGRESRELNEDLGDSDLGDSPTREFSDSYLAGLISKTWLLLYCSLLWAHEQKRSAGSGEMALGSDFGLFDITSDPLGLFFRSRAIISSPVTSIAQTNIGLQFALTAIHAFPDNAGIHHTSALYYLRRASLVADGEATYEVLSKGLDAVNTALLLDSVFAGFYATKAKIQYKMGLRQDAFSNLQSAIEIQRYDSHPATKTLDEWINLLDSWQLG
jgi:hypothetical protein